MSGYLRFRQNMELALSVGRSMKIRKSDTILNLKLIADILQFSFISWFNLPGVFTVEGMKKQIQ